VPNSGMAVAVAKPADIDDVLALQFKYHVGSIEAEDKSSGFVTTLFTRDQLTSLIDAEGGLFVVRQDGVLFAYAMAASWGYWSQWPMFAHMLKGLHELEYCGRRLSAENSYQYGPVCIAKAARGSGVLERLFDFARAQMARRYPILVTFINKINTRSFAAHTRKLGLEVIQEFEFNGNQYHELVYDTAKPLKAQAIGGKIEKRIIDAEERLRLAMLGSDVAALDELLAPELVFTSHLGQVLGKQDDLDFHRSGLFKLSELTASEQRIQIHGGGVAVVCVLMHLSGSYAGASFDSRIRYTRVWSILQNQPWRIVAGHASAVA